jgi:hypothetical protein
VSSATPSPADLLMPGGSAIGTPGSRPTVRVVPGGRIAADALFDALTAGGTPVVSPTYPGQMVDLPGGGRVGFRPVSKSGEPTIDVDIPGIPIKKIKFI